MEEKCFKLNIFYNNYIIQNNDIIGVSNNIEEKPEMPIIKFVLLNDCDLNPFDENKYEIQIKITITRNNEGKNEVSEYYTTTNNLNTWMTLNFGQKYIINWQKNFYCGNVQIICRDKSNKRILNTIQFSVYGETKVYFEDILTYNQPFMQAYQINREYTSLGKEFGMYLKNQDKYNVFYDTYVFNPMNGLCSIYDNFSDLNDEINNPINKFPQSKIINQLKNGFQNNQKHLLIISLKLNSEIKQLASTLNHEEGAHRINRIQNKTVNVYYEHKEFFGKDCTECNNGYSPDNEIVLKKYKNSKCHKNLIQIENKIKKL